MRRLGGLCLVLTVLAAGCGGSKKTVSTSLPPAPPITTAPTSPPVPTITSAADVAACNVLARNLRVVSTMTANSTQVLVNSLHPKQLAQRVGQSRAVLLYAGRVMQLTTVPPSLRRARDQFVSGLRRFAGDFGRAQRSVQAGDMPGAASELQDAPALAEIAAAARRITQACGA